MNILKLKTEYAFGEDATNYLSTYLSNKKFKKALLVYGGGSIKKNGLYTQVIDNLNKVNCEYLEASGISPNPLASEVMNISLKNRNKNIDILIAIGGGSVLDSSKIIAALISNEEISSILELKKKSFTLIKSLPIIAIPTTASTGSENNAGAVITIDETSEHKKGGLMLPLEIPMLAIEDSKFLSSASDWQIAAGIYDTFCHNIDEYFGNNIFGWTKEYLFANIRNILKYGVRFLKNRDDVEARDNVMWTSSMSLNSLSSFKSSGNWEIHLIEHSLSGKWNITHGAGNALLTPTYIKVASRISKEFKEKAEILAKEVFNVKTVEELIEKITSWIIELNLPTKWTDFKEIKNKPTNKEIEGLIIDIHNDPMRIIASEKIANNEFIFEILNTIKE